MQSMPGSEHQMSQESNPLTPRALWSVDLKLTHLDWNPEATLIHFQGHYLTICELDYNILQGEIQNIPKNKAAVAIGEFCLVEDATSARWFRGRVQNQTDAMYDVFLIDHGNVLSVDITHISSCSNSLFNLPPKIVCGFLSNVLLLQNISHATAEKYFSSLIGKTVTGFIQALLPHKVLLLEAPDINCDLVRNGLGRSVDTETFILLVSMLTEVPLKQNIEPVPDLLIEKPRVQEFCFKSSSLQGYEDVLSFCGPRLTCETRAKVRITAAVNPGLFYCQMANVEEELWQMSKRLAQIFEHRTKEYNQKTAENLGLLCAVKGKDEKWYRGFVQFLPVNSQVRVFFIDYGFFEFVKVKNIHRLPPEFYSAPVMALPCSLPAKTGQDVALKAQQLGFLKAGLLGAVLDVEIGEFDVDQHLYTITVLGAEETHVEEPEPVQHRPIEPDAKDVTSEDGLLNCETIVGEVFSETLQAEEVQVGSVFVGYVEHAQNPNNFWIRTQKRNEEFEQMMLEITKHFSQVKLDEDVLLNIDIGTMCCAVYEEDMHFYRGVVMDILKHGAEILFIDFGNTEKVPHALIKDIPETAADKSAFAICCTLANIFPLDDVWPSATCDFFRKAVLNKVLQVRVVQIKKHKCVVELFETGSDYSIAKLLTSFKLAEYISVKPATQNGEDGPDKTKPCSETAKMCGKSEQWEDEEENTCVNETKAKVGFRASNIELGLELSVRCLDITSPSDFWCQLLDKVQVLDILMDEMQKYYSVHTVPLQPGESLCVAKSPQDGKWYRGVIIGRQKDHSRVMLVDYGPIVEVKEQHLQAIALQFFRFEELAFRCSLNNLTEPADPAHGEDWSPEETDVLKEFVLKSATDLKCQVVSQLNVKNKGLTYIVELYNSQQSVTDALKEQRLARRATLVRQESDVLPESFVYSSFDLHPGSEEEVYVTHVSSQCEFYCQLDRNTEIIEELENKISEESEKLMEANTTAAVGKLCLAKYLDGKWYRALMLPVQSQLHFDVFFVDYGNTNISEKTKVMFIPRNCEDLLYTPMQAVRCHLDLVPKAELYADVKKWLCDAIINQLVRVIVRAKRDDGSFDVELFDGEVNINEKVKELILSIKTKTVCLTKNRNKMRDKTHYKITTNTPGKLKSPSKGRSSASTSNVQKSKNTKNITYLRSPNKNTTTNQQNESDRWKVSRTKSKVQQKDHQDVKSNQTQKSKETKTAQLCVLQKSIRSGFRTKCFVSHIDSVSSFFLQLAEDEPDILKLCEDLNASMFRDSLKLAASFQLGDVVLAEFEEDGALYRSVIKTQESSSCFKVEFVDYGNFAVVQREKMYPMPEEYLSRPRFSIPCSLLDTSSYETDSSFTDAVVERPLIVDFIRQHGIQWKVKVEVLDVVVATQNSSLKKSLLSEISENVTSCEQNLREKDQNDDSTVEGGSLMPAPSPVRSVVSLRCVKRRGFRRRRLRKTKTSTAKAKDFVDTGLPTIQPRDTETGTILSVRSDGSFYIRLVKNNDLLTGLEKHITNNLNKCKTVGEACIKEGLRCLVQIQEDKWERAVVQQVSEGEFKVFLVDSGITKDIPSMPVLELETRLSVFPNLAVLCKMNSLGFIEEEEANQCWYKNLEPMIGSEVKLIFVSFSEADNSWMVEIVMDGPFLLRQIKASRQQNLERFASSAATQSGPLSDASTPQQLVFAPVETGKGYSGFAAVVTTPSDFCVVLEDLLLVMNKVSVTLDNLPQEMPPLPKAHVRPGTCCLFKPESRNRWCRAEIIHADASVVLDLVDHGQYECLLYHDLSKLKKLPAELTDLPKVTFPCTLRGVRPVGDGQWSDKAAVFFQKSLYQKNLKIFFREFVSNSDWNVDIVVDGVHVAKKLVDAGHADYTDDMLQLRFQAAALPPGSEEEEGLNEAEAVDGPDAKQMFGAEPRSKQCFLM
ncbi:tudor domain-containing protein 15 [Austrofundulus limnaeus]|uniref:Tudor domain-containing protein 15 n=1 Tax=Austrofundulus limnaeus TaxID=52670 RepID=A0A2I4D266_AUSLI|nr:PREDICTED: tudor domain-containing protein 15 [Austrofundulus limnaeus]